MKFILLFSLILSIAITPALTSPTFAYQKLNPAWEECVANKVEWLYLNTKNDDVDSTDRNQMDIGQRAKADCSNYYNKYIEASLLWKKMEPLFYQELNPEWIACMDKQMEYEDRRDSNYHLGKKVDDLYWCTEYYAIEKIKIPKNMELNPAWEECIIDKLGVGESGAVSWCKELKIEKYIQIGNKYNVWQHTPQENNPQTNNDKPDWWIQGQNKESYYHKSNLKSSQSYSEKSGTGCPWQMKKHLCEKHLRLQESSGINEHEFTLSIKQESSGINEHEFIKQLNQEQEHEKVKPEWLSDIKKQSELPYYEKQKIPKPPGPWWHVVCFWCN